MRWQIEVAPSTGTYTRSSAHDRAWDAWRTWDALAITGGTRKRIVRNGRVIRREHSIPTPPVAQEALWPA